MKSKCKLHPRYKGIRKPTSKKDGCTCMYVYYEVNRIDPFGEIPMWITFTNESTGESFQKYLWD